MHEETFCFKGAVSRNSAKLGNYKMPVKRNVKMKVTQQIQQMPRMGKTEEDLRYPPRLFWGIFNQRMKAKFATSGHHIQTKTIFCDLKPEKKQWRFNCYPPAVSVKLIINLVLGRDFHFSLLVLENVNKGKYHSPMSKKMRKR